MDDEDSMVIFSISKNKDDYTLMQVKGWCYNLC